MRYKDARSIGRKTRFVFEAPKWYWSALIVAALSAFYGILVGDGITYGLLLLGLPAYASLIICLAYARIIRETYRAKTEMLVTTAYISFSGIILVLLKLLSLATTINLEYALMVSLTIPLWIRHLYLSSIIVNSQAKALPLSIAYPSMVFLSLYFYFHDAYGAVFFICTAAVSLFFSAVFLLAMDAPMKNVMGIGGLKFTKWTVEHYKEKSEKGHDMLEAIFDNFGEDGMVFFDTVSFVKNGELKASMLVHSAHPGPVGEVGGGDLPSKLGRITGIKNLVTPHGASTHDMNPTTENEVKKLGTAVKRELYGKNALASEPVRTGAGKVSVLAQRFGDRLMIIETSYPYGTEDISPGIAVALKEKVKRFGYSSLIFIDAHNCFSESAGETRIHTPKYAEIEKAVTEAAEKLANAHLYPVEMGFGQDRTLGINYGLANLGIQSIVLKINEKKIGYIVLDGNNMVKGLRNRIIEKAGEGFDFMEVMTSDNHYVNRISGGKNPVGQNGGYDAIVKACIHSVNMAENSISKTDVRVGKGQVRMRIFGPNRSAYLFCIPRTIDGMGRYLAFLSLLSLIFADVFLAMLI